MSERTGGGAGATRGRPSPDQPEPPHEDEDVPTDGRASDTDVTDVPLGVPTGQDEFRTMKERARRPDASPHTEQADN